MATACYHGEGLVEVAIVAVEEKVKVMLEVEEVLEEGVREIGDVVEEVRP